MRRFALLPLASCFLPLLNGCAKSPSGGPTVRATNRFQTTLSLAGTLNQNYYYGVAFDDTGGASRGPVALDGSTTIFNGVMGGTFRLLVLYHANSFRVFYRSTPTDTSTEREITGATNLFDTGQVPHVTTNGIDATANGIDVTINLDAQFLSNRTGVPVGTYVFPRATDTTTTSPPSIGTDTFNINVACTNTTPIGGTSNFIVKPVDALGRQGYTLNTPVQVQIGATRTISEPDPTADEKSDVDITFKSPGSNNYVDFSTIDVTNLQIGITRFSGS